MVRGRGEMRMGDTKRRVGSVRALVRVGEWVRGVAMICPFVYCNNFSTLLSTTVGCPKQFGRSSF